MFPGAYSTHPVKVKVCLWTFNAFFFPTLHLLRKIALSASSSSGHGVIKSSDDCWALLPPYHLEIYVSWYHISNVMKNH